MAFYQDITIEQGADFAMEVHLVEPDESKKDLTLFSVEGKLKRSYTTVDSDQIFDFNAYVANPGSDGVIVLELTNEQTDSMTKDKYVYDIEISHQDSDGNTLIERVMEGYAYVKPSVTK